MTAKESSELKALREELRSNREELRGYHESVIQQGTKLDFFAEKLTLVTTDMYGLPGNKESSPGLMGVVGDLQRGRRTLLWAVKGAWALLVGLVCAAISGVFQK